MCTISCLPGLGVGGADASTAYVDSSFLCISVEDGAIGRLSQYIQAFTAAEARHIPGARSWSSGASVICIWRMALGCQPDHDQTCLSIVVTQVLRNMPLIQHHPDSLRSCRP